MIDYAMVQRCELLIAELEGKANRSERDDESLRALRLQLTRLLGKIPTIEEDWIVCNPIQRGYTRDQIEDFRKAPGA